MLYVWVRPAGHMHSRVIFWACTKPPIMYLLFTSISHKFGSPRRAITKWTGVHSFKSNVNNSLVNIITCFIKASPLGVH